MLRFTCDEAEFATFGSSVSRCIEKKIKSMRVGYFKSLIREIKVQSQWCLCDLQREEKDKSL